jgi:hypothetical protein
MQRPSCRSNAACAAVAACVLALHGVAANAMTEAELRAALKLPDGALVKAWPGVPDRTIVAWVYEPSEPQGLDDRVFNRTLLIARTSTGDVVQRLDTPAAYTSDAIEFDGLAIDTANYALAPDHRAFGLRAASHHRGCAGFNGVDLELFDVQGPAIVPVLAPMATHGRSDMCGCGEYSHVDRTIAIGSTRTKGYADLVVQEKRSEADEAREVDGQCQHKDRSTQRRVTLHFDGRAYEPMPGP